jgi:hypothetical protein
MTPCCCDLLQSSFAGIGTGVTGVLMAFNMFFARDLEGEKERGQFWNSRWFRSPPKEIGGGGPRSAPISRYTRQGSGGGKREVESDLESRHLSSVSIDPP